MDSSFFLTTVAAAIGIFTLLRKLRFDQDSKEQDSSLTPSSSVPPSSLTPLSPVPPSSSSRIWRHDVFPSFRGEDVRKDFLSHFLAEFQRMAITPFIDNEIRRGESIGPELIRAIRESKIAVILISKNYASSKWCLDELVEIMKCRDEELGQTVMPIFYRVDPSDVKKFTGHFGKVFKKTCAGKTKEVTERWKQALAKVATIAGYDSSNWDTEADMIKKIATDISNKLNNSTPSSDFDELIGMRAHLEALEPLLCLDDSEEVRMIGIWGPPGIGKTTIARAAYNKFTRCFQLCVFMDNIKVNYKRPCFDDYSAMLQLQQQFMSDITNHKDMEVSHLGVAQDRLKDKKVLVVLDGVDHILQLDAMVKKTWWFGPGSRIIITTQDQKLFRAHGINHIYKVYFPGYDDALKIFCMYAFGQKFPIDGFEELARRVTMLVGYLPLGLRVMGSYFRGMSKQEWIQSLPKLETSLDAGIESVLRFSYDALDDEDKDLFLHIACFFNGYEIKDVEEHLAKKFLGVRQRLNVLADKSLISIRWESHIEMHSLFVKLGRVIVRKQSIQKPGQRQFLVDRSEICEVLSSDAKGCKSVIGIIDLKCGEEILGISEREEILGISERAFERMPGLQFLKLNGYGNAVNLPRGLNYLPPNLHLLDWSYFPMSCLPPNVSVEFLVELIMRNSKLENMWEGIKRLPNLKRMNLQGSNKLKVLPDLSTATNLEKLDLSDCSSLVELPLSIRNLQNLQKLILKGCSKLEVLPTNIDLELLEELDLTDCSLLRSFPQISTKVKIIRLGGTAIEEVSSSIMSLSCLEKLLMPNSRNLKSIIKMCLNDTKIQEVPLISTLRELELSGCRMLVSLPQFLDPLWEGFKPLHNLTSTVLRDSVNLKELPDLSTTTKLEVLDLNDCSCLVRLPFSIGNATNLRELNLSNCSSLVELPFSIGNLQKLMWLKLKGCSKLQVLPNNIKLKSLYELDLTNCSVLKSFPEISTNITKLRLEGTGIEDVPLSIGSWPRLNKLSISYFENLKKNPHALECITNLYFSDTEIQEVSPWIKRMSRLDVLVLEGCRKLVSLPQIPDSVSVMNAEGCQSLERLDMDLSTASKLRELNLSNCSSLTKLPSSIGNAAYLEKLDLSNCSNLVELPFSVGKLEKLRRLMLKGCSNFVEFPSSIGNAITNLCWKLDLSHCSSLRKLPSSIGKATNLSQLDLSDCSSLVELPLSIGNLQKLMSLELRGCSKLVSLPQIPDSLSWLNVEGCESVERLDMDLSIASKLGELNLRNCTSLTKLPSSIGNAAYLEKLDLSNCSNLVELPFSIGNLEKLRRLILKGCSNLVEIPSSIANATTNLVKLDLSHCSSLRKLPTFIWNATSLWELDLSGCLSLVELPLSIGNFQKLQKLRLRGCSKLEVIPANINLKSLEELDLTDCSMLKSFPEISTNIKQLSLMGTAIEEVPLSIQTWSRLDVLYMSYFDNLKEFSHALECITNLYFRDTEIQEVPPWIKRMSRLHTLDLKRCRKLVSLSQIPDSVSVINAEGCQSLERLDMDLSNATKLEKLNLRNCSSLTKLPSSIGNAAYLEELDLSNCSNLVELPFSIGNLEKLRRLILEGCSNLVEFPSSVENAITNLEKFDMSHCSNLRKLPSSIWNAINLTKLYLSDCLSLVELPLSIGNLQKLKKLRLQRCSKLEVIPTDINLKSLEELDLTDCSMLKSFHEISTNIKQLSLMGTAIEEVPLSIQKWSRLDVFCMSYFENLKEFPHALDSITVLGFRNTEMQEIPPLVMRFSRLLALALEGCRHLVSLPQFPDSLLCILAEDCVSLERLDCSFYNSMAFLYFVKCFKMNKEARDLIIQTETIKYSCLPGREVPSCFTHLATCGDCSMTINFNESPLPKSMRFKACFWLLYKGDDTDWKAQGSISVTCRKEACFEYEEVLREHLYIFEVETVVTSSELVFDFSFDKDNDMWKIGEFGLLELPPKSQ